MGRLPQLTGDARITTRPGVRHAARMARWYSLEPADTTTFGTAPQVYRYPIRLRVPPARVWESLASDESLAAWGLGVRRLTWTTPRPFGVGTTREVVLPLGSMTVRERFFRWDEGA